MSLRFSQLLSTSPNLTDGAWGTQMQARGLAIGECPDAWNLTFADRVESVARAYVRAGSYVILTNTFGANRIALQRHGLDEDAVRINQAGVEISRKAAEGRAFVFASMGPSGKLLAAGEVTESALREAFEEQAAALGSAGADAIVVETMSDLTEAVVAVRAAMGTGLPVVGCMTFDTGTESARTIMGVRVEDAAEALAAEGASVVGANCGRGAAQMLPVCRALAQVSGLPVWIKPNAGIPELVDGKAVYTTSPEQFAGDAEALVEAGAAFIGGCCGTGPEHILALGAALEGRRR